jgi:hypothetical protein
MRKRGCPPPTVICEFVRRRASFCEFECFRVTSRDVV